MNRTLLLVALALPLVACKKPVAPEGPVARGPAPPAEVVKPETPAERLAANFKRVNFDYDSAVLTATSREALAENARILAAHPAIRVEVQGHCDERGTTDYNLALGDRRATVVRDYLAAQGVSPARVTALSYGEERPLAPGAGEVVWAQNRRAEFRVLTGADGMVAGTID